MPVVVLVHGAWHGPWCWEQVQAGLRRRGIVSYAPGLPLTGLADNVDKVRLVLGSIDDEIVLCGHSGSGNVITRAASNSSNVCHLVYLCAMMLDEGVTAPSNRKPTLINDAMKLEGETVIIDPDLAYEVFYNDCTPEHAIAATRRLCPVAIEVNTAEAAPARAAWRDIASTYVVCARDRSIHPDDQRSMARVRASRIVEWDTSHSPFICQPQLVINLLAELVEAC